MMEMPIHLDVLRAAVRESRVRGRMSASQTLWLAGLGVALATLRGALRALHCADDILVPTWRDTKLESPVFILTCPRSGSTRLHRLLALDTERFTTFNLVETILPSALVHRATARLRDRPSPTWTSELESRAFAGFQDVHRLGLALPEEDEALFVHAMLSPTLMMLAPAVEALGALGVDALPRDERDAAMRFYRESLQRHLSAYPGRTLLVKNVWSATRLHALLESFPDARVVCLRRRPSDAVLSAVSMFSGPWRRLLAAPQQREVFEAFGALMESYYRRYATLAQELDPARVKVLDFNLLTREPEHCLEGLYEHFGWSLPTSVRTHLQADARPFESKHRYSAEDFGLDAEAIDTRLAAFYALHATPESSSEVPRV